MKSPSVKMAFAAVIIMLLMYIAAPRVSSWRLLQGNSRRRRTVLRDIEGEHKGARLTGGVAAISLVTESKMS